MKYLITLLISIYASFAASETDFTFSGIDKSITKPSFDETTNPRTFWNLTEDEWMRYQQITTTSPWSVWEHNATPLALLSFYSKSENEKRRYARRQAELDEWREAVTIEWQKIYNIEREQVRDDYLAAIATQTEHKSISSLSRKDQVLLFIDIAQCDAFCKAQSRKVLDTRSIAHFYFLGKPLREDIFSWATQMDISTKRVKQREITLNTDSGEGRRYGVDQTKLIEKKGIQIFYRHKEGVKEIL